MKFDVLCCPPISFPHTGIFFNVPIIGQDRQDLVSLNGQRLGPGLILFHGVDPAIGQNKVGGFPFLPDTGRAKGT